MRMNVLHVIRREYTEHVRKKSFLVATFLVPVFMLAFLVVPLLITFLVPDEQYDVIVADETGEVGEAFARAVDDTTKSGEARYRFRMVAPAMVQEKELVASLESGEADIALEIPADVFDTGKVRYTTRDVRNFQILDKFENTFTAVVIERRLARAGLDYEKVSVLTTDVTLDVRQITGKGEVKEKSFLSEWGLVFGFVMILYMALLTWGIAISRGILEEKSSRVVEVLLSSIEPRDLLLGKVVGIGLAGLTQMAIWAVVGFAITAYAGSASISFLADIKLPVSVFIYFVVYFVLGFLFYASIFTVVGSVCSNEQDAQQLQGLVTMPMVIPLLVLMLIIQSPNSPLAVVLSLIPPFTPMIMLGRIVVLEPSAWQIALSIALMLVSIYLAVAFSARVFRVGILMYGKRPSLPEIIKWYRQTR